MRILRVKNNTNPGDGVFFGMDWLEVLNEQHNDWVAMVKSFGEITYSEDLVQETYLRIYHAKAQDRAVQNGKPNRSFMYIALRNNHINFAKQKAKVKKYQIEEFKMKSHNDPPVEWFEANDILEKKIQQVMEGWHWYDRQLFELLASKKVSMRKLSRDSGISLSSLSNTMKKCRQRLIEELGEDFQDYFNKEYKRIK